MAAVHKSRWYFFAVVLLVVLAAIWVVRGSGSNDPVQAGPVTSYPSGAESSWSELDIISGEQAPVPIESDESVPSDTQIDLAHHTNDSHGGVTMITTATVPGPIPDDSDGGVPAP